MIQYKLVTKRKTKKRPAHPVLLKVLLTASDEGWKLARELGHQRLLPATLKRIIATKRKDEQRAQARRQRQAAKSKVPKLRQAVQISRSDS